MIKSFNSNENLTSPEKIEEDQINENNLRPLNFNDFVPATFTIEPSGARFPERPTTPPIFWRSSSTNLNVAELATT